jgi:hypothetical protein
VNLWPRIVDENGDTRAPRKRHGCAGATPIQSPTIWRCADEIEKEWEKEEPGNARAIQLEAEVKALYAGARAQLGPEWKGVLEELDKLDC